MRTIAASSEFDEDDPLSGQDPEAGVSSAPPDKAETTPTRPDRREPAEPPGDQAGAKRRNPWIWISALLAIVAAGSLLWALTTRSDLDNTSQELDGIQQELAGANQELDSTQQDLDSTKQDVEALQSQSDEGDNTGGALLAMKALYDEFSKQLGATQEDVAATQDDLGQAEKAASKAEEEAAAAKREAAEAGNQTDKLEAQADQTMAETKAAESKATVAGDCRRPTSRPSAGCSTERACATKRL